MTVVEISRVDCIIKKHRAFTGYDNLTVMTLYQYLR